MGNLTVLESITTHARELRISIKRDIMEKERL